MRSSTAEHFADAFVRRRAGIDRSVSRWRGVLAARPSQVWVDRQGEEGRPHGTVRAAGSCEAWPLPGNLEFLALIKPSTEQRLIENSAYMPNERIRQCLNWSGASLPGCCSSWPSG
jgi:hypothetical protein